MGVFDWLRRGRRPGAAAVDVVAWHVYVDGGDVLAEDGRGGTLRAPLAGARSVRIVPLSGGDHHRVGAAGWQIALARADGDVLLGKPLSGWQTARELADQVCQATGLPLDELSQRLFSRVGQYSAPPRA